MVVSSPTHSLQSDFDPMMFDDPGVLPDFLQDTSLDQMQDGLFNPADMENFPPIYEDLLATSPIVDDPANMGSPGGLQSTGGELPLSGCLQQLATVQGSCGCTNADAPPAQQPARSCPSRHADGTPSGEPKPPLVRYFNEDSPEFWEFVVCCLKDLNGNREEGDEAGPGTDTAPYFLEIRMHGSCILIVVFRKGWPNSKHWDWLHQKAEQEANDGSRPLQIIIACPWDEGAEEGTKPNMGGRMPIEGFPLMKEWATASKEYLGKRYKEWTFAATRYRLQRDCKGEPKSVKRRRSEAAKEFAVYVMSEDHGAGPEHMVKKKSGEDKSVTEMCAEACLTQRRRHIFLEAIQRGESLEKVREAGDACGGWTEVRGKEKEVKVKEVKVKKLKATDFCEIFGRSSLHLAVTMRNQGGSNIQASSCPTEICDEDVEAEVEERLKIVKYLLPMSSARAREGRLRARNNHRSTPLHVAAHFGHCKIIQALLDAGAQKVFKVPSKSGWLPTHVAANRGNWAALKLLLQHASRDVVECNRPGDCKFYKERE